METPKQHQHDHAIMDAFASDPEITPLTLILANKYRMRMKVTYVSALGNVDGTTIPFEKISDKSEWRAVPTNGLKWPNTVHPTERHQAAFRKCLQMTLCPSVSPQSRSDYELQTKLGKWYPHQRNIEYRAY